MKCAHCGSARLVVSDVLTIADGLTGYDLECVECGEPGRAAWMLAPHVHACVCGASSPRMCACVRDAT
jgi:hypothetical protein